jgi:excisionase family DNA binding protein
MSLADLSDAERAYIDELEVAAAAPGASFFSLRGRVAGSGAFPTRAAGGWVTPAVMGSTVFRVAQDIVDRLGIAQGKLGPPTNAAPAQLLSVSEAARLIGVSRQAINASIMRKAVPAQKIGRDWILRLEDVRAYQASAATRPAPGRSVVGRKRR